MEEDEAPHSSQQHWEKKEKAEELMAPVSVAFSSSEQGIPVSSAALPSNNGFRFSSSPEPSGVSAKLESLIGKQQKQQQQQQEEEVVMLPGSNLASSAPRYMGGDKRMQWFHVPGIPRPQDQFMIKVNNKNEPFEHALLERSDDGKLVHPVEKLSVSDFVSRDVGNDDPVLPPPLENTPFTFVDDIWELMELTAKLNEVDEFAVDLEHHKYRSFQGLTCLMQISTRTEDFVVDTLKLWHYIGPYLREAFKDPSKRKVMHGADSDIQWLQRDFGIYVCNLFDTGQASREMQLKRNSLEYLLLTFCDVIANKQYQTSDWRLRPLPDEMIKYAREDTHYLLYLHDVMRSQLLAEASDTVNGGALLKVYRCSYDICRQLYQKELLTDTSYLSIPGLQDENFNSEQLAVAASLYAWRDRVARFNDESTGCVLPKKALLKIAKHIPQTPDELRLLVESKHLHPYVERYINDVIHTIQNAVQNAFESDTAQLRKISLKDEAEIKMQQKRSSASLPVYSFPEGKALQHYLEEKVKHILYQPPEHQLPPMNKPLGIGFHHSKHRGLFANLPERRVLLDR